eukprot:COSAG01_NODE_623_length_14742_cov_22.391177_17_plen_73_part_00
MRIVRFFISFRKSGADRPASPTLLPLQRRLCGLAKVAVRPPLPPPSPPKSSFWHAGAHSDRFVKTDDDAAQV